MIPLRDDNPIRGVPVVTIALILLCSAVFLWQLSLPADAAQAAVYLLGFMPALLFGHATLDAPQWVPPGATIFTSMFLHGGFLHLASNMLYLWISGDNVEDRVGRGRFVRLSARKRQRPAQVEVAERSGHDAQRFRRSDGHDDLYALLRRRERREPESGDDGGCSSRGRLQR